MDNSYGQPKFYSPSTGFQPRNQFQSTPKSYNQFHARSLPYSSSPKFNHPNSHIPRSPSPYKICRGSPKSFNSSNSSPGQWSDPYKRSYSSDNNSSSYFGDVSQLNSFNTLNSSGSSYNTPNRSSGSSFNTPNRSNGSPFYHQNRNNQYQRNRSSKSNDSNPGHLNDINLYVHQSMLEDPWKDLMAEIERKN